MYLIDAGIALMLVLSMLVIGFTALQQKAFQLEDSRRATQAQLEAITKSDECTLNPKVDCDEGLRVHA